MRELTRWHGLIEEYARLRRLEGHTPQSRGRRFNDFIADMLGCWGINARTSVRTTGEVDVVFTVGGVRYVVEAKAVRAPFERSGDQAGLEAPSYCATPTRRDCWSG